MPELIPVEPRSSDWLAARRAGVTATDIVSILGLNNPNNPNQPSAYSLFWRKMGQIPDTEDNDRFALGRYLEGYIELCWSEQSEEAFDCWPAGLYRSSDRTWQMATPDRVLQRISTQGDLDRRIDAVLELKTWAAADRHSWGIPARPGENLARGEIPAAVRAQVLWQMDVMDVAAGHVGVVFLPSGEFRSYVIEHERSGCGMYGDPRPGDRWDCSACADLELMRAAGEEFMARLRLELPPPDPDSSAATLAGARDSCRSSTRHARASYVCYWSGERP